MPNNKYTPIALSKKLAELGVEVESESYYLNGLIRTSKQEFNQAKWDNKNSKTKNQAYYRYTLSDMPEVLKAVGEKKSGHKLNNLGEYTAKVRFEYICSLYYDSPNKAWQYLEDLLDNK